MIVKITIRFSDVFSEGLGRYTVGEVSLRLRPDSKTVFLRARPLAYALREPVERELDKLVANGVITPVDSSDWATPIVPVIKPDGTSGWPNQEENPELKPFFLRKNEIYLDDGCIMWGDTELLYHRNLINRF